MHGPAADWERGKRGESLTGSASWRCYSGARQGTVPAHVRYVMILERAHTFALSLEGSPSRLSVEQGPAAASTQELGQRRQASAA